MVTEFWLSERQWKRLASLLPRKSWGVPRVDDRGVISGIVHVLKSGGCWVDAPAVYGPRKTLYNRFVRWGAAGIWRRLFQTLATAGGSPAELSSTARTSRRTASPPEEKGAPDPGHRRQPRWPHHQDPCSDRRLRAPGRLLPHRRPCC